MSCDDWNAARRLVFRLFYSCWDNSNKINACKCIYAMLWPVAVWNSQAYYIQTLSIESFIGKRYRLVGRPVGGFCYILPLYQNKIWLLTVQKYKACVLSPSPGQEWGCPVAWWGRWWGSSSALVSLLIRTVCPNSPSRRSDRHASATWPCWSRWSHRRRWNTHVSWWPSSSGAAG